MNTNRTVNSGAVLWHLRVRRCLEYVEVLERRRRHPFISKRDNRHAYCITMQSISAAVGASRRQSGPAERSAADASVLNELKKCS